MPDMEGVRAWGDAPFSRALIAPEFPKLKASYHAAAKAGKPVTADLLALSGGADDGAFGAGLLVGWGKRGDRAAIRSRDRHQRGFPDCSVRIPGQ